MLKINAYEPIKIRQNFHINQAMIWEKLNSNTLLSMNSSPNFLMRNLPGSILSLRGGMVMSSVLTVVDITLPNVRIKNRCPIAVGIVGNFLA